MIGVNTEADGNSRTIKSQYCKNSVANFVRKDSFGATAVSVEVSPEVIGGIGEKNFGKQYRQGNRIYDGEKIATALESQPVGNTGGSSNLYAVDISGYTGNRKEH